MDNNEKDVFIGREYEKAFESICELVRYNCIDKNIVSDANLDRKEIRESGTNIVYRYNSRIQSFDSGNVAGMTDTGASWFDSFRSGKSDNDNAAWMKLIESVASNYHKKYSFVEFLQKEEAVDPAIIEDQKEIIDRFIRKFCVNLNDYNIEDNANNDKDNIYGISLKIEIDGGTGEAEPVLCKIYFRMIDGELYPLSGFEANDIEESLYQVIQNDDSGETIIEENGDTIDLVLNAVESLIEKRQFRNSVVYSSEEDKNIIERLLEKSPNDITELTCRSVNVFGISHVEWKSLSYIVTENNRDVLSFRFSMNNKFSVFCLNCGETLLVEGNRFLMLKNKRESKILNPDLDDFGYTNQDIEYILENAVISNHIVKVKCSSSELLRGNKTCDKIRCINQLQAFETEDGTIFKCKNCPYPEIITQDENGNVVLTRSLTFVRDLMQLVSDKVEHTKCKCCGREFTVASMRTGKCPLCYEVEHIVEGTQKAIQAMELYKEYSDMIPLPIRIRYSFNAKYCVEDDGIILFKLGEDKYIFNKIESNYNGFLNSPKIIK